MTLYPYTSVGKERNLKADVDSADKAQGLKDARVRLLRRDLHSIGIIVSQFISSLDYAESKEDLVDNPLFGRFTVALQITVDSIFDLTGEDEHAIDAPAPEPVKEKGKGKGKGKGNKSDDTK